MVYRCCFIKWTLWWWAKTKSSVPYGFLILKAKKINDTSSQVDHNKKRSLFSYSFWFKARSDLARGGETLYWKCGITDITANRDINCKYWLSWLSEGLTKILLDLGLTLFDKRRVNSLLNAKSGKLLFMLTNIFGF